MNHNINILNKIADLVGGMGMFYSINIWKDGITLQGNNLDIQLPYFEWVLDDGHKDLKVYNCIIKFESIEITLISVQDDTNTIHDEIEN